MLGRRIGFLVRKPDFHLKPVEIGMVTVELAIAILAVTGLAVAVLHLGLGSLTMMRAEDAARSAARAVAVGENGHQVREIVRNIAGKTAQVEVKKDANWAHVKVIVPYTWELLGKASVTVNVIPEEKW